MMQSTCKLTVPQMPMFMPSFARPVRQLTRSFRTSRPVNGLFGIVFEGVLISSGCAAIRRTTGVSIKDIVASRLQSRPRLLNLSNSFFNVGEFIFDKGVAWAAAYKEHEDKKKAAPSQSDSPSTTSTTTTNPADRSSKKLEKDFLTDSNANNNNKDDSNRLA